MRRITKIQIVILALSWAACGRFIDDGEQARETTSFQNADEPKTAPGKKAGPPSQEDPRKRNPTPCEGPDSETTSIMSCPVGKVDGCLLETTKVHRCVVDPRPGCDEYLALQCPEGQVDGCTIGATTVHECVDAGKMSCNLPIALECPEGQISACVDGFLECVDEYLL